MRLGLPGASSIVDKTIPTFSRGELPHFAGINTFLKAPYLEDANQVGKYDAAVVGVPFDGGCTYRAGTRFGPQGIRRISALYTPYNYEKGIDLREQMVRVLVNFLPYWCGTCRFTARFNWTNGQWLISRLYFFDELLSLDLVRYRGCLYDTGKH